MEPRRLLDDDECSEVHALLRAGIADEPTRGAATRALAAVGVVATLTTAGATAAGAASGGKTVVGLSLASVGKLAGAGFVAGTLVAVTAIATFPAAPETAERSAPGVIEQARPLVPSQPAPREPSRKLSLEKPVEPTAPKPNLARPLPSASAPATEVAPPPLTTVDTLPEEIALLDRARNATSAGKTSEALALLDRFAREYPASRLGPEAFVSRIEALIRGGRGDEARALARQWLTKHPRGSTSERIRKFLPRDQEPTERE